MSRFGEWLASFLQGPLEQAAQARLDEAQLTGVVTSREEAERLSDDVWRGRAADRGADKDYEQRDSYGLVVPPTGRDPVAHMFADRVENVGVNGGERDPLAAVEAEAARDRAERVDPNTARMVEARDQQAAGGRFDDADSTQRLIDAVREQPAEHELQGRTQDVVERTLSVDEHGALLRSAFDDEPAEHRDEPAEPGARGTEPEVREL